MITNYHVIGQAPAWQNHGQPGGWPNPPADSRRHRLGNRPGHPRLESETLPTITLGDSDKMKVGHFVLAFGSPLGLNQTVTHGIIKRPANEVRWASVQPFASRSSCSTDAAINPGSSGGAARQHAR